MWFGHAHERSKRQNEQVLKVQKLKQPKADRQADSFMIALFDQVYRSRDRLAVNTKKTLKHRQNILIQRGAGEVSSRCWDMVVEMFVDMFV
jgi:hypothetical protein